VWHGSGALYVLRLRVHSVSLRLIDNARSQQKLKVACGCAQLATKIRTLAVFADGSTCLYFELLCLPGSPRPRDLMPLMINCLLHRFTPGTSLHTSKPAAGWWRGFSL